MAEWITPKKRPVIRDLKNGEIRIDRNGNTGVNGIFTAGDVTDISFKQIIIASGNGASTALSVFDYLMKQV